MNSYSSQWAENIINMEGLEGIFCYMFYKNSLIFFYVGSSIKGIGPPPWVMKNYGYVSRLIITKKQTLNLIYNIINVKIKFNK